MKIIYTLICSIYFVNAFAQVVPVTSIESGNVKGTVHHNGQLFHSSGQYAPGYEFPLNSGKSTIYSSGFRIGGTEDSIGGTVTASWIDYTSRFQSGPISSLHLYASEAVNWETLWKVSEQDIANHIANFNLPGYTVPTNIASWPAHGDVSKGQSVLLAPFVDVNNNGIYDPQNGDYPKIKGHVAAYFIQNDETAANFQANNIMGIELHTMVYAFSCDFSKVLNNTIFVEYTVHNRRNKTFYNTYMGSWNDLDIGCSENDYIGTDVQRGMIYGFNASSGDPGCPYQDTLPFQGVIVLAGPYQDANGIDNPITQDVQNAITSAGICYPALGKGFADGITDNERLGMTNSIYLSRPVGASVVPFFMQDATTPVEAHNYLRGHWSDGTTLLYGGTGHFSGSPTTIVSHYVFPDKSDSLHWGTRGINPGFEWSEINENNPQGDRRIQVSSGPFTFFPGDKQTLELAFTVAMASDTGLLASFPVLQAYADQLHQFFDQGYTCNNMLRTPQQEKKFIDVTIYPNPTHGVFTISTKEQGNFRLEIFDVSGKEVKSGRLNGMEQVDLTPFDKGIYLVRLSKDGIYVTKKIILN